MVIVKKKNLPENSSIIGFIYKKKDKEGNVIIDNETYVLHKLNEKSIAFTSGYAQISNEHNQFVEVKTYRPFLFILLLLLLLIMFLFYSFNPIKNTTPQNINVVGDDWSGEMPSNAEKASNTSSIEIPGYSTLWANSEYPTVELINPKDNDVYFVYILKLNNEQFYKSDYIKPNGVIHLNLIELMNVGEHKVQFEIHTYDMETLAEYNGSIQDVSIMIYE